MSYLRRLNAARIRFEDWVLSLLPPMPEKGECLNCGRQESEHTEAESLRCWADLR